MAADFFEHLIDLGVPMAAARLAPEAAEFYRAQSPASDPGRHAELYRALPDDPAQLARVVRGLLIHRREGPLFGFEVAEERLHDDAETRYVDEILGLIAQRDGAPLSAPRRAQDRFVGVCRDFALLLCSFLRAKGVPARIRCGFADYLRGGEEDPVHGDHVVTEYWDARRGWLLADAQIADGYHETGLDPADVPRDRFLVAGKAWQLIRAGRAEPARFGLFTPEVSLIGYWFVAVNIRLDLSALNKVETLPWDIWGIGAGGDGDMTDEIYDLYDLTARVADDEVVFEAARTLFAGNAGVRTPATVLSFAPYNGPREITLRR